MEAGAVGGGGEPEGVEGAEAEVHVVGVVGGRKVNCEGVEARAEFGG